MVFNQDCFIFWGGHQLPILRQGPVLDPHQSAPPTHNNRTAAAPCPPSPAAHVSPAVPPYRQQDLTARCTSLPRAGATFCRRATPILPCTLRLCFFFALPNPTARCWFFFGADNGFIQQIPNYFSFSWRCMVFPPIQIELCFFAECEFSPSESRNRNPGGIPGSNSEPISFFLYKKMGPPCREIASFYSFFRSRVIKTPSRDPSKPVLTCQTIPLCSRQRNYKTGGLGRALVADFGRRCGEWPVPGRPKARSALRSRGSRRNSDL